MEKKIYQFLVKYHGNWDDIRDAINKREQVKTDYSFRTNSNIMFIIDENYHDKFKQILLPPFFTFYKGDIQFLSEQVIGIEGKISSNELAKIVDKKSNKVLCFNNNDFTVENYNLLISKNIKFIVVCEGGIDSFKYEHNENILLISEYDNIDDYQPSNEQTVERLLHAISNEIVTGYFEIESWKKLTYNLKNDPKKIIVSKPQYDWLSQKDSKFESYSKHIKIAPASIN